MNKSKPIITPEEWLNMLYTMSAGSGSVSCSGSCSQGKCVKKTAGLGQVTNCDGCESVTNIRQSSY